MAEGLLYRIRHATESDLAALEWDGEYRRFRRLYRAAFEDARRGERALLVADVEGQIVGQLFVQFEGTLLSQADTTGYLYAFRVRPPFRNQGIGTALVREGEALLARQGLQRAVIAVARDNEPALRLYERLGYVRFGEDSGMWSYIDDRGRIQDVVEPAFLLEKILSA
ncbi:MAG TPA: GNAT family N-acetyltransferase [Anaerolineales bacterium]|nr:GNAT family N-acetyltransferase [Anaerolineales bacterium]